MTANAPELISERALQDVVIQVARLHGWWVHHHHDSRRSEPGWPDLVLIRPPRALFVELKAEAGKATSEQTHVLDLLERCGLSVAIWRPSQLDEIIARLTRTPEAS